MAKRVPPGELATLQRVGENTISRGLLNDVMLTRAIRDGYLEPVGMDMVKLTEAGFARLDELLSR